MKNYYPLDKQNNSYLVIMLNLDKSQTNRSIAIYDCIQKLRINRRIGI